jgi:hypothetical protein
MGQYCLGSPLDQKDQWSPQHRLALKDLMGLTGQ